MAGVLHNGCERVEREVASITVTLKLIRIASRRAWVRTPYLAKFSHALSLSCHFTTIIARLLESS